MQNNYRGQAYDGRYKEATFEQYASDPRTPKSIKDFIVLFLKNKLTGYLKNLPVMLIIMIPLGIVMSFVSVYFWAVVNDTMWMGSGNIYNIPFISSFVPYLIGGGVSQGSSMWGNAYKGAYPFDIPGVYNSGNLVAPLTFSIGLLIKLPMAEYF